MEFFEQWINTNIQGYIYLIPIFPLIGFLINGLLGTKLNRGCIHFIGVTSILASFLLSVLAFYSITILDNYNIAFESSISWIKSASFNITWGFNIDPLSGVMLLIVTGVGLLIHFYSIG